MKNPSKFSKGIEFISQIPWLSFQYFNIALGKEVNPRLFYVVPDHRWVTFWIGKYVIDEMKNHLDFSAYLISKPQLIFNQILHFGELGSFLHRLGSQNLSKNKIILTIFHGNIHPDYPQLAINTEKFVDNASIPEKIVVTCKIMQSRLKDWGIPEEKTLLIPLGIDLNLFKPPTREQRQTIRQRIGIPENSFCIGSFQKDGVGWKLGMEPKLIKGPDIFLQTIEKLSQHIPNLFILLSAPARGYIKQGLEKLEIPYSHTVLKNYLNTIDLYHCLDTYLVTSREEGGPMAILEALACGIPVVSTRVGMAPDLIRHNHNGLLAEIDDVKMLTQNVTKLFEDITFRINLSQNGMKDVKPYDWESIAKKYYLDLYKPLLQ